MAKYNRSITIEFSTSDDDDYCDAANFIWHAAEMSGMEFRAFHDGKTSPAKLNERWDAMGSTARWRK